MIGCSPGNRLKPALAMPDRKRAALWNSLSRRSSPCFGQIDGLEAGADDGRRQGVGEEIGPGPLAHQVDDGLGRRDIAAGRAAQRLAQRAGEDIGLHARPVRRAAALRADEAGGVAIIDHHQRIMGIGELADIRQLGEIAIHGEHAIGDDDDAAGAGTARLLQLLFEIVHVAIGEAVALGLGQADAVDDRGMVQGIGNDGILLAEQRLEHRAIGIETGGEEDGVIHAEIVGDAALQRLVNVRRTANETHRSHAQAVTVHAPLWRRR